MSASNDTKGIEQTPQLLKQLIQKCYEAKEKAYSPYSKFRVGAAILTENGEFVTGKLEGKLHHRLIKPRYLGFINL